MSSKNTFYIAGIRPKRALGQTFLVNPYYLDQVAIGSGITRKDIVLEIGAGVGNYTKAIASRAKKVFALEFDRDLIKHLKAQTGSLPNVQIIEANALTFDYTSFAGSSSKYQVAGNLPYNIATELIFRLLDARERITSMSLMVQLEVAHRIASSPGTKANGVLGIICQAYSETQLVTTIPASAFYPKPKVESALVRFDIIDEPPVNKDMDKAFRTIVKAAFSKRRKILANSLFGYPKLRLEREELIRMLEAAGIDPKTRAETLGVDDYVRLTSTAIEMDAFSVG